MLAWCTVHRRIYKPLRSRLEHGLGSTPSASTMRSKLIRMSSRFLIGRQLVRFQPDAPRFRNCGRMVRRSTFNRDGESSILSSSTSYIVLPASSLVVRIADLHSADGGSIVLAGAMRPVLTESETTRFQTGSNTSAIDRHHWCWPSGRGRH